MFCLSLYCLHTIFLVLFCFWLRSLFSYCTVTLPINSWIGIVDLQLFFFFSLNRVAALLNTLCCHRARTACPRWAQSVSVLPPLHWGLQAECWPLRLLFYFVWLILLVSSAAGENTANSQKPFFLTASTLVPFSLVVFLLFCLTCFCCSQHGLFVILMSSLCSLIFLSIPCATFFYLSWEIHRHLLKFSSFFSQWTGWSLSFALIITNHSSLLVYSFNSAKSVVSFSFFFFFVRLGGRGCKKFA